MRRPLPAIALLFLVLPAMAAAQSATVRGKVVDPSNLLPINGVYIRLVNPADTTQVHGTATTEGGVFILPGVPLHAYRLQAERVGYAPLRRTVQVDSATKNLGTFYLAPEAIPLAEVDVEGTPPPAIQKNDTTEFSARAFKTNKDATAEELVAKLPGITVENGTVKSNGEQVQQVLVDGKPFFGNDPSIAMRNLPADVVDKIQVFDKMSDQSEFTGFDDGQTQKTLNFQLRPDRRKSRFGKVYGGHGDTGKYAAGGNANIMNGNRRISLIGLANNVNQQNFAGQDLLGVLNSSGPRAGGVFQFRGGGGGGGPGRGGRGGGGGPGTFVFGGGGDGGGPGGIANFLVGPQNGITTTSSAGGNYTDQWAKGLTVNQSYFFNYAGNENSQVLSRQYVGPVDSANVYEQSGTSGNRNYNHRFDTRVEYAIDSLNSLVFLPRMYFQDNHSSSQQDGQTSSPLQDLINMAHSDNAAATTGDNLSSHLVMRHRFRTRGRTLSMDVGAGHNGKDGSSNLRSLARYFGDSASSADSVNQRTLISSGGSSLSARLTYTEPLGKGKLLQLTYNPSRTQSHADNGAFRFDPATQDYTLPDTGRSNQFETVNTVQGAEAGFLMRNSAVNLSASLAAQSSALRSERIFPQAGRVERTFFSLLPSVNANFNLPNRKNLRLIYRASTRPPGISQLQDVVDNSNPLALSTGDPNLRQSTTHSLVARYSATDPLKARSLFLLVSVQRALDYIGNSVFTALADTVVDGIVLKPGTQLTRPANLDGYWSANSFGTLSVPFKPIKSTLNFNAGAAFSRTPGRVNDSENIARTTTLTGGLVVASNVSESVDFTVSYSGNYNIARNSLVSTQDHNYYNHSIALRSNLTACQTLVFHNELAQTHQGGLGEGYNTDVLLWNASLARKFLAERRGELKLSTTDILDRNRSAARTVTETYFEDTRNRVLGPYTMLTFTYSFR